MTKNVFTERLQDDLASLKEALHCLTINVKSKEALQCLTDEVKSISASVGVLENALWATNPGWHVPYLKRMAPVATVVDVGVWKGTPELYEAFPEAYLVMVEPLVEHEGDLDEWLSNRSGEKHLMAAGPSVGEIDFYFRPSAPQASSAVRKIGLSEEEFEVRKIHSQTLDGIQGDWPKPYLIKIDTDGFELGVIQGATETLKSTNWVVAEVSVAERFVGGYSFHDFVGLMHEHGFRLADVMRVMRREDSIDTGLVDAVFKRY